MSIQQCSINKRRTLLRWRRQFFLSQHPNGQARTYVNPNQIHPTGNHRRIRCFKIHQRRLHLRRDRKGDLWTEASETYRKSITRKEIVKIRIWDNQAHPWIMAT